MNKNISTNNIKELMIKGAWNLKNCKELQNLLLEQPSDKAQLIIDLSDVTELDLTSIQLIAVFQIERQKELQTILIKSPKSLDLEILIKRTGFLNILNCNIR
jgi:anti-anti-sigma regulatory factor